MKILAPLILSGLLLGVVAFGANPPSFVFLPTNTNAETGLVFWFENAPTYDAQIEVVATVNGKFTREVRTIDTDGESILRMEIGDTRKLVVNSVTVSIGGYSRTVYGPVASQSYSLRRVR